MSTVISVDGTSLSSPDRDAGVDELSQEDSEKLKSQGL